MAFTQDRDRAHRLCAIVEQRAGRYADDVEEAINNGTLAGRESELLDTFEQHTSSILDRLASSRWPKSHELVFKELYDRKPDHLASECRRTLLVALLAAEVEFHGPLKLTQAQNSDLAAILEELGAECLVEKLHLHAAEAFDRAAEIHLLTRDNIARDRCLYRRNLARQRIERSAGRRALLWISWLTCGYGYKPYRLLLWVLIQLVVFGITLVVVARDQSPLTSLHMVLTNYLNPAGGGDTNGLPAAAKSLLLTESYVGALSLNIFFALLVRRWFR
ncbi:MULTISPECIES: hypothetical protein [Actinokineospora]|uniref:hypothetical protein n=1 Tax=Actinokineospora TaxID=39845 RepID=UPI00166FBD94|nr:MULTISPECIES: hypothetical protein [Actinokineospora]UVS79806.1 hypothetical protein Actkin_03556 [Actinokineospora sp. UTMC 2448]